MSRVVCYTMKMLIEIQGTLSTPEHFSNQRTVEPILWITCIVKSIGWPEKATGTEDTLYCPPENVRYKIRKNSKYNYNLSFVKAIVTAIAITLKKEKGMSHSTVLCTYSHDVANCVTYRFGTVLTVYLDALINATL